MSAILLPGPMLLRQMKDEDLADITRIEKRAYTHPWTMGIFKDCMRVGYYCQVLEQDGVIHGYGVMSEAVGEAHILNICIHPDSQGQGLGRMLVDHLISSARRMANEIVLLEVRPSNKVAIRLYHDMGFCEVGTRRNYYPSENGREDALILALNL